MRARPGRSSRETATRLGRIQLRRWRRAWRIAASTGRISPISVSWRERLPKSAEIAAASRSAFFLTASLSLVRSLRRCCSGGAPSRANADRCASKVARMVTPPQLGFQYLAVIVLRQRFEKDVVPRTLESRDSRKAQSVELVHGHFLLGMGHHTGDDFLTPVSVRAADDGHFQNARVPQQNFLDLAG